MVERSAFLFKIGPNSGIRPRQVCGVSRWPLVGQGKDPEPSRKWAEEAAYLHGWWD